MNISSDDVGTPLRALLLAVLSSIALAAGAAELPLPPAVLTLLPNACTEFVPWPDGTVWAFQQDGETTVWDGQGWKNPGQPHLGRVSYALETKPGEWALATTNDDGQTAVTRVAGKDIGGTVHLPEGLDRPSLLCTSDDTLWVLGAGGAGYSVTPEGKTTRHDLSAARKGGTSSGNPPLTVGVPGHGLWFWCYGQASAGGFGPSVSAAPELSAYENGAWRQVPLAPDEGDHRTDKLGGVAVTRGGDLLCGKPKGLFTLVSPATGAERPCPLVLPAGETCTWLAALRNGDFLAVLADPLAFPWREPKRDGWCGTLLRINGKTMKTKVLLSGVDFGRDRFAGDRPWVETDAGAVLAAANAGLVLVPADGSPARHLDWRSGVPFANTQRLRAVGDRLYLLDRDRGFAICDLRKLMVAEPLPEAELWQVEAIVKPPMLGPDGALWYLTAAAPAEVKRAKGSDVKGWSLAEAQFPVSRFRYMTFDSKGRVWLFAGPYQPRVVFVDKGAGRGFPTIDAAYVAVAQEEKGNPGFAVGTPADPCFGVFAGDGRVAYRGEQGRLRFFDGTKWDEWTSNEPENQRGAAQPSLPFYQAGFLTVYQPGKARSLQLRNGVWQTPAGTVVSPYPAPSPSPQPVQESALPKSFPGGVRSGFRGVTDNVGTLWAGSPLELYRGLGDVWVRWSTLGTPLSMADGIGSVWADGDGNLWFTLTGGDYPRLAHYRMQEKPPALTWRSPPPAVSPTGDIKCTAALDAVGATSAFSYRLDEGEWKAVPGAGPAECALMLTGLANGKHTCAVRAFDAQLRSSNVLTAEFQVQRDYTGEIRENMRLLGSADFATRENASRTLAALGPVALPALTEARKAADKDLAWWLDATIQEINDRAKAAGTAGPKKP